MTTRFVDAELTGPEVWLGPDIQDDPGWLYRLDDADMAEIDAALHAVKAAGLAVPFAARAFALPTFAAKLDAIVDDVTGGRGIALVRGLPAGAYDAADLAIIYWGIGSHIGTPVSQNRRGHLLGHVRDEGRDIDDPTARPYQTAAQMDFHCDLLPVDMLGLCCVSPAKAGGESYVVNALAVHNVIRAERPDLLAALYTSYNCDWANEEAEGARPWFTIPFFSAVDGRVTSRMTSRRFVQMVTRHGAGLAASPAQLAALEFAQQVACRPELRLTMTFREGDMQFLNNHTMLHGRAAFEDHPEPGRKRHLLRMWIALDAARRRPVAPEIAAHYRVVDAGGIPRKDAP